MSRRKKGFYDEPHCVNCRFHIPTESEPHDFGGANICLNSESEKWGKPTSYDYTCPQWQGINWDKEKGINGGIYKSYKMPALPKSWMEKIFGKRNLKHINKNR